MRTAPLPHPEVIADARYPSASQRGFSLVELLVTIVLAGIIFAAMVPLFASALKRTGGDNSRVTATALAQDRIEKIRQLPYPQIAADAGNPTTTPNLYNSTLYPGGQFATTYKAVGSSKTYNIAYSVVTDAAHPNYKDVTVTVTWGGWGPNYTTTMETIVMDPEAASVTSTANPYPTPTAGYKLTISFKDATQLVSPYVKVTYVQSGVTKTATPSPAAAFPLPSKTSTVTYYALPGGTSIPYTVTCKSSYMSSTAPLFHLLTDGWIKFDTHPGGS